MPEAAPPPPPANTSGAQPGVWIDPYRAYNFKLEIQGVVQGHFTSCSGLEVRVRPIRYREGGVSAIVHTIPGYTEYGDVTLQYGLTDSRELWDWLLTVVNGRVERRSVSIIMLDPDGVAEKMRWNLLRAWPSRWVGAPLDALQHEIAIESLTLVYESLERV